MNLKMKKNGMLMLGLLAICMMFAACGGGGAAEAQGKAFESKYFKVTLMPGWTVFEDTKLPVARIYPEKDTGMYAPTIHLKFEGPLSGHYEWAGTPDKAIADMSKSYGGSAPEKEVIGGLEYYKTTYTFSNMKQTMYIAKKDGTKVSLTLVGTDYDKLPEIPAMVKTIAVK